MLTNTNDKPHVLFLGIPSYGHTMPTIYLVKTLIELDYKVTYFNTAAFKDMIESAGAIFADYNSANLSNISLAISSLPPHIVTIELQKIFITSAVEILPTILTEEFIAKFAIIIYDQMAIWGHILAKIVKKPALCSSTMLLISYQEFLQQFPYINKNIDQDYKDCIKLIAQYDNKIRSFKDIVEIQIGFKVDNVIIYAPFELQQRNHLYKDKKYIFLGNRFDTKYQSSKVMFDEKSLIYVSLGTVFNEKPEVFKTLISFFSNCQNEIIISTGHNENIYNILRQQPLPGNMKLYKFVDQLAVLPRAALFVTHAGFNSIYEGLYLTVPMLMIPHNPEQFANARRVEQLKAGYVLNELTLAALSQALEHIKLDYLIYKNSCQIVRNQMLSSANNYDIVKRITKMIN